MVVHVPKFVNYQKKFIDTCMNILYRKISYVLSHILLFVLSLTQNFLNENELFKRPVLDIGGFEVNFSWILDQRNAGDFDFVGKLKQP